MKEEKGICTRGRIVYGTVTVSDKGQVAIPVDVREDLNIKAGDRLLVLKREDDAGLVLLKLSAMDELLSQVQRDEEFFRRQKRR